MRTWLIRQVARFVAADPGLRRLRSGGRVVAGVVVTLVVLIPTLLALGQSPVAVAPGVVVVLLSQLAVNEPARGAQVVTTLSLPVSATVSLSVASLLADRSPFGELAFVVVMFVATYARRFGPRASALGFAAFIAFFLALFLQLPVGALPAVAGCAVFGAAAGLLARFVLLPERGHAVRRSGIRALRARVRTMLHAVDAQLEQPGPRRVRRVHDELMRLNQTALAVEGDIDLLREQSPERVDRLRRMVLEVELTAEHLVTTIGGLFAETTVTSHVRSVLSEVGGAMRRDPSSAGRVARQAAERLEGIGAAQAALALRRLGVAAAELADATGSLLAEVGESPADSTTEVTDGGAARDEQEGQDDQT